MITIKDSPFFQEFFKQLDDDTPLDVVNVIRDKMPEKEFEELQNDTEKFEEYYTNQVSRLFVVLSVYSICDVVINYSDIEDFYFFEPVLDSCIRIRDVKDLNETESEIISNSFEVFKETPELELPIYILTELKRWGLVKEFSYNSKEYKIPLISPNDGRYLLNLFIQGEKKAIRFEDHQGHFKVIQSLLSASTFFKIEKLAYEKFRSVRKNKHQLESVKDLMLDLVNRYKKDTDGSAELPLILSMLLNTAIEVYGNKKYSYFDDDIRELILKTAMNQTNNFKDWGKIDWKDNYLSFIDYLEQAVNTNNWSVDTSEYDKYSPLYEVLPSRYINNDFFDYKADSTVTGKRIYRNDEEKENAYLEYFNNIQSLGMYTVAEKAVAINGYFENLSQEHMAGILYGKVGAGETFKTYIKRNK